MPVQPNYYNRGVGLCQSNRSHFLRIFKWIPRSVARLLSCAGKEGAFALALSVPAYLARTLAAIFRALCFVEEGRQSRCNKKAMHIHASLFLVEVTGLEPTTSWSLTKRATKLRYTSVCFFAKQHNLLYMIFRKSKTILPAFREFFNFWMTLRPWPPSEQFWPFRHERGSKRKRPAGAGPLPAACSNCPNIERQRRLPPRPPQK